MPLMLRKKIKLKVFVELVGDVGCKPALKMQFQITSNDSQKFKFEKRKSKFYG